MSCKPKNLSISSAGLSMSSANTTSWIRISLLLLTLSILLQSSLACPYYQRIPTNVSSTTNYTLFSVGIQAAMNNSVLLIVCDKARVLLGEAIPTITTGVTVMGENPLGTPLSYLVFEDYTTDPHLLIDSANTDLVVFENLNIVYETTLFHIIGESHLTLRNVKCDYGQVCVNVDTGVAGVVPPGLEVDTALFMENDIGILFNTGFVTCQHCTFIESITASVLVRNPTPTPSDFITMYDHHYLNVLFPIAQQIGGPGTPLNAPDSVSIDYVDGTNFYNCQTYESIMIPSLDGAFGGTIPNSTCPVCVDCNTVQSGASQWGRVIGGGMVLIVIIGIFICITRMRAKKKASRNTYK